LNPRRTSSKGKAGVFKKNVNRLVYLYSVELKYIYRLVYLSTGFTESTFVAVG